MRVNLAIFVLGLLVVPAAAQAQDMRLDTFLQKAERLERRGALALFSSDLGLLKEEVQASARIYRQRIGADHDAGRAPHSCPPEEGSASLNSNDILEHFRSYPASRRQSVTVRTAFFDMMARRYPCD
ncbi:hypothetical protein [Aurantiacibacter poecillastricola]|uniref:hypothetical protein n=1 Tax=Aurantiacibacter poecillastricola TaxID=3064385 RepID=UPI00274005E6|nr:hypothetical protein [Aurantiacibacter sp. 219JJ12-13]MDP5261000.1 hypothetical protein [Aurantiacibacter sp. 219JJ12-13]